MCLFAPSAGTAAVIAPPPGKEVVVLDESVIIVHDPLTSRQTVLVQHTFEGTGSPFGILIPTPKPANVEVISDRVHRAFAAQIHPQAQTQRSLELNYVSWAGACSVREVGDPEVEVGAESKASGATAIATNLGAAPEPLHDWLLSEGFTVAPAQALVLDELRGRGWTIVAVAVHPPSGNAAPAPRLRGPALAITHEANEPIYAASHPPFALTLSSTVLAPPLELGVLTEWAVGLDVESPPTPFYADAITGRETLRIANESRGERWSFRRDGTLTVYAFPRPTGLGIVRFVRVAARPPTHPAVRPIEKVHRVAVPIELLIMLIGLLAYLWTRVARGRRLPRLTLRG